MRKDLGGRSSSTEMRKIIKYSPFTVTQQKKVMQVREMK